jgi:hypothetical protein
MGELMTAVAALQPGAPPRPETFTTSSLLLREIYDYLQERRESSIPLQTLADEVFFRIMRDRYGADLYDATLTSDGHVLSSGLADDVGTLVLAGYVRVVSGNSLQLTPTGSRRAGELHPPR